MVQINNTALTYSGRPEHGARCLNVLVDAMDFGNWPFDPSTPNPFPMPNVYNPGVPAYSDFIMGGPFTNWKGLTALLDLTQAMTQSSMRSLQSVFIDNSINPGQLGLINLATNQRIIVSPFSQGVFPILLPETNSQVQFALIASDGISPGLAFNALNGVPGVFTGVGPVMPARIQLMFMDIALPIGQWEIKRQGVWGYNCSGAIAVGLTFQVPMLTSATADGLQTVVMTPDPYRRGFHISHMAAAGEPLYVLLENGNTLAPAIASAIELAPGERYEERGDDCYRGQIMVTATTAGHTYTAYVFA